MSRPSEPVELAALATEPGVLVEGDELVARPAALARGLLGLEHQLFSHGLLERRQPGRGLALDPAPDA
jgi:hypothetical protein